MKKLIMAAYHTAAGCRKAAMVCAIVCAATLSQAATFSWSAGAATQYMPTSWANKTAGDNQASGNTTAKKIAGWVTGGMEFTTAVFLSTDGTEWNPSVSEVALDTTGSMVSGSADFDNSLWPNPMTEKKLYYKVVITGTYTDDKGTWTATGTIGGTTEDYIELVSLSADELSTATVGSWDISFQGTGPVPEPTSGLLLLLGVAGLALRRRRA